MELIDVMSGALLVTLGIAAFHPEFRRRIVRLNRRGRTLHAILAIVPLAIGLHSLSHAIVPFSPVPSGLGTLLALVALIVTSVLLVTRRIQPADTNRTRRVLVVGAHPDDLELGCGGTLAKLIDEGAEVHAIVMTNGSVGAEGDTRVTEAETAARFLGIASVQVFDEPDTNLHLVENRLMQLIEETIKRVEPDLIFTHSAHDHHQDHESVHRATLRAARGHQSILCFESPSATREFSPSVFVDVSEYTDIKVHAVHEHRDQRRKPYMHANVLLGITAFRGRQARCDHAEGFEPVRLAFSTIGVN
ncbi:PIG-L deacetylase family protein [Gulosibacter macacae]|nr:PIG-L deacetylase family protein [Gulosibacter macacae]